MRKELFVSNNKETEIRLAQYREAYEDHRHQDKFMWQVLSLATVISGGLIIASFAYIDKTEWWARDIILVITFFLTLAVLIAVYKHRYFDELAAKSLSRIEDALGTKRIQRTTKPESDLSREDKQPLTFWFEQKPEDYKSPINRFFAKKSSDKWLIYFTWGLLIIIIICIIISTVLGNINPVSSTPIPS